MIVKKEDVLKQYEKIDNYKTSGEKIEIYENMYNLGMKSRKETDYLIEKTEIEEMKKKLKSNIDELKMCYDHIYCFKNSDAEIIAELAVEAGIVSKEESKKRVEELENEKRAFAKSIYKLDKTQIEQLYERDYYFEDVISDMIYYAKSKLEGEIEQEYPENKIEKIFSEVEKAQEDEWDMIFEEYYFYFPERAEEIYDKIRYLQSNRIEVAEEYKKEVANYSDEEVKEAYDEVKAREEIEGLWNYMIDREEILFNELKKRGINIEKEEFDEEAGPKVENVTVGAVKFVFNLLGLFIAYSIYYLTGRINSLIESKYLAVLAIYFLAVHIIFSIKSEPEKPYFKKLLNKKFWFMVLILTVASIDLYMKSSSLK